MLRVLIPVYTKHRDVCGCRACEGGAKEGEREIIVAREAVKV